MPNHRHLRLVPAAGVAGLLCLAAAHAGVTGGRGSEPGSARPIRAYEGVSERGSFQDALDSAVTRALRDLPGADRMVRYRVREITGERGGIRGANVTRVSIEVTEDAAVRPGVPLPDAPVAVRPPVPQPASEAPVPPPKPQPAAEAPVRPRVPQPQNEVREEGPLAAVKSVLRVVPERMRPGDTVSLELEVRNTGKEPIQVPLTSGQQFDFEVRRGRQTVWRWGQGQAFAQAPTSLLLEPGKAATFRARWDGKAARGARLDAANYQLVGYLTAGAAGPRVEAKRSITVSD